MLYVKKNVDYVHAMNNNVHSVNGWLINRAVACQ